MTQNTVELERLPVMTDSFVAVAERVPTTDESAEMAEQWVQNPVARISRQLDELAVLYDGRTDRTTFYDFNGRNHQFDTFATREADGGALEEIYTVHSQFSAQHGYLREYAVTVLETDGHSYHMAIQGGELSIKSTRRGARAEVTDLEERDWLVADFFYRSLIATVRTTTERTIEQRQDADLDALIKLEQRTYDGRRKVVTATG